MEANKSLQEIRSRLSHMSLKWRPSLWLDTNIKLLNNVAGHTDKGLPYGRMIEITGWESSAKSANTLALAALAQRDGAHVIWGDIENSFEPDWAIQRGIIKCLKCRGARYNAGKCSKCNNTRIVITNGEKEDCSACICSDCDGSGIDTERFTLIQPYVGKFTYKNKLGKMVQERDERLSTAQELCEEIEECMKLKRKENKSFVVIDSIAALLTEGESAAGISGANMSTNTDLARFVGRLLRRWVGLAQVHNAMIIFINQLREGPAKFGDPTHSMGGNAPKFYSHVRLRMKRVPGSKIVDKGKVIGIRGTITALKNKTGGEEGAKVGFRLFYKGKIEFVPAKDVMEKGE